MPDRPIPAFPETPPESLAAEVRLFLEWATHPDLCGINDRMSRHLERLQTALEPRATRRRIYIAGPYSSDPEGNTARAITVANQLLDIGLAPYVPHLTHYLEAAQPRPYNDWLAYDLHWLEQCEAVLRLPGESPGADGEVARARELGLPVFHSHAELLEGVFGVSAPEWTAADEDHARNLLGQGR